MIGALVDDFSWLGAIAFGTLILVVAIATPIVSRQRSARMARDLGAVWVGLANFEAAEPQPVPAVADSLAEVGPLYGHRFNRSPLSHRRPVGGRLILYVDRLTWSPTIWLGRGAAQPWRIATADIVGVSTRRCPLPAVSAWLATIRTTTGSIEMIVVDPKGLQRAIEQIRLHQV